MYVRNLNEQKINTYILTTYLLNSTNQLTEQPNNNFNFNILNQFNHHKQSIPNSLETQNITSTIESYYQHINSINSFISRYLNLPNTPHLNNFNNNFISLTNKIFCSVNNEELTAGSHILSHNFDELREKIAVVFDTEKTKLNSEKAKFINNIEHFK